MNLHVAADSSSVLACSSSCSCHSLYYTTQLQSLCHTVTVTLSHNSLTSSSMIQYPINEHPLRPGNRWVDQLLCFLSYQCFSLLHIVNGVRLSTYVSTDHIQYKLYKGYTTVWFPFQDRYLYYSMVPIPRLVPIVLYYSIIVPIPGLVPIL